MILSCYLKTIFQLNFKKAILISFCSDFDTFVRLVYMVKGKLILLNRIMKLQPTLLKIVPLVTVVTGIVASMEMANAAGSTAVNNNAHPIEETITAAPNSDAHSEAATAAPVGDTHSEAATAAPVGDTHSEAATAAPVGDTHREAATAAPVGDTHREAATAAPVGDTHREAATAAPVGDTHGEAATAAPVGNTHREAATVAPVGNTHQTAAATAAPVGDTHGEAATAAPVGNTHGEAATVAPVGNTHGEAATVAPVGDTHGEAAGAVPHGTSSVTESPLSPRLQQIEFFAFLGAIGLAIVIPELLYRPKKIAQNFLELENSVQEFPQDVFSKTKDTQEHEIEPNLPQEEVQAPQVQLIEFGKAISKMAEGQITSISQENSVEELPQEVFSKTKDTQEYEIEPNLPQEKVQTPQVQLIEFSQATPEVVEEQTASISQETTEVEEQIASISADIPDLKKIIPDNIQPYTIPNRRQSQSDIDGQIEIDNWSQPERKTA